MRKKLLDIFIILICVFIFIELLVRRELIYSSIIYALNIWVKNLIPALFPFFIISDILINYNIIYFIPKRIKDFCKVIWGITDNMLMILLLSMLSGFPSNARNTRILYDTGKISLDEANHILIFSHFSNPIFILTTVGVFFFKNEKLGIIILISHYISNFILGIFFRNKFKHIDNGRKNIFKEVNIGSVFVGAVKRGIDTILMICGIVVMFLMLASILINLFNFNSYNAMIIKGLFEITIGIEALGYMELSSTFKAVIASMFLAFGGLSVHMQVVSQITDTKISYHYFFTGRLLQMIISGGITYFICLILRVN